MSSRRRHRPESFRGGGVNFLLPPDAPGTRWPRVTPAQKDALARRAADRRENTARLQRRAGPSTRAGGALHADAVRPAPPYHGPQPRIARHYLRDPCRHRLYTQNGVSGIERGRLPDGPSQSQPSGWFIRSGSISRHAQAVISLGSAMPQGVSVTESDVTYRMERCASGWEIRGFFLLLRNNVPDLDPLLPYKKCIHGLGVGARGFAVLVGGYTIDNLDDWTAIHRPPAYDVDANMYCGDLFSTRDLPPKAVPGRFFPHIGEADVLGPFMDNCYRGDNALLMMVNPHSTDEILAALNSGAPHDDMLERLEGLADWVILPGHDGVCLRVRSSLPAAGLQLRQSCEAADRAVRATSWFQAHQEGLVWDESYACYRLRSVVSPARVARAAASGNTRTGK